MSLGTFAHAKKQFLESDKIFGACIIGLVVFIAIEMALSPMKALLLIGAFVLFACSWNRPLWVISSFAFLLPLEPFLLKWVADDIYVVARYASEVAIYAVVGATLIKKLLTGEKIYLGVLYLPFVGFFAIAILSTFANQNDFFISLMGLRQLFRFILLYIAIVLIRPSKEWTAKLLILLFGLTVFEGVLGLFQALAAGSFDGFLLPNEMRFFETIQLTQGTALFWQEGQRIFATLGRYDQLGTFLCFFILLAVGILYEHIQVRWKKGLMLTLVIGSLALLLTYSRASWFGMMAGIALISIAIKKDMRVAAGFAAAILLGIGIYATLGIIQQYRIDVADQTVAERFFEAFSPERIKGEYYALGRIYFLIKTPLAVLAHAPLVGVGPGRFGGGVATALHETSGYTVLNVPYGIRATEGYVDNNWLSLLGETGIVGLAFYIAMFVVLFRLALRVYRRSTMPMMRGLALGYCGALIAFAFQGLFATYFEVRTIAPYVWMFGGILAVEEI